MTKSLFNGSGRAFVLCLIAVLTITSSLIFVPTTPSHASPTSYTVDCSTGSGDARDTQTKTLTGTTTVTAINCSWACTTGSVTPQAPLCYAALYMGGATTVFTITGASYLSLYTPGIYGFQWTFTSPPSPPSYTSSSPTNASVGVTYNYSFAANGTSPITFSLDSGTLPAGLTLASTGTLTGTPTHAGVYTFSVRASNGTAPDAITTSSMTATATYNVSFAPGSGASGSMPAISGNGTSVALPLESTSSFTKPGYHFSGWTDGNASYTDGQTLSLSGNLTLALTAVWSVNTFAYSIAFAPGAGASGSLASLNGNGVGFALPLLSTSSISRAGYHFVNWSDGINSYGDGQAVSLSGPMTSTLTAQWQINTYNYSISFASGPGGYGSLTAMNGTSSEVRLPDATSGSFYRPDHHAVGWTDGSTTYTNGQLLQLTAALSLALQPNWVIDPAPVPLAQTDTVNLGALATPGQYILATSATRLTIPGSFSLPVTNIYINGLALPLGAWTQTTNGLSITLPSAIGVTQPLAVEIYNGGFPSIPVINISRPASPTKTPTVAHRQAPAAVPLLSCQGKTKLYVVRALKCPVSTFEVTTS